MMSNEARSRREPRPRKTRKAYNEPGHAHFLTFSCYKRYPLLLRDTARSWVIESLESVRKNQNLELWAYVIMPEHVHALINPRDDGYEMRSILAAIKKPVANKARNYLHARREKEWLDKLTVRYPSREVFRFWQPGGGYDHNIFRDRTVRQVIDYIHENPVRRGLVEDPCEWRWSSAAFWQGATDVPILLDDLCC